MQLSPFISLGSQFEWKSVALHAGAEGGGSCPLSTSKNFPYPQQIFLEIPQVSILNHSSGASALPAAASSKFKLLQFQFQCFRLFQRFRNQVSQEEGDTQLQTVPFKHQSLLYARIIIMAVSLIFGSPCLKPFEETLLASFTSKNH